MNIKYIVEIQSGGNIIKDFDVIKEAEIYYNDNIKLNAIMYKLEPFKLNGELYYYCIGSNVISAYNNNYSYITKLGINPCRDRYNIDNIKSKFAEYLSMDSMPVF